MMCLKSENLSNMGIVLASLLLFGLVGGALAVPYMYLAGNKAEYMGNAVLLLPVAAITFCVMRRFGMKGRSWAFVAWVMLPIACNALSKVAAIYGAETTSAVLFEHRFDFMWIVGLSAIALLIARAFEKRHQ